MDGSNKELTKVQKDFIGTKFETPKGGVLTVTGVVGKHGSSAVFSLECSICSEDSKLWPAKSIKSTKGHLVRGGVSCGCAVSPRWSEGQTKIRVKRECEERGYEFRGWVGEFKGNTTKLSLFNPITGNGWDSTSINSFFKGNGDPVQGFENIRKSKLKDDSIHIQAFIDAGLDEENYSFWRSERKDSKGIKSYWYYSCNKCSHDEYASAGLCTGVFESKVGDLKLGQKSCRCSDKYQWGEKQREVQIKKVCDIEGLKFVGWTDEGGYKNSSSKFGWLCPKGHKCSTEVISFLNTGRRCNTCRKETSVIYGYYSDRASETDFLYLTRFNDQGCIKVGRSFDVNRRTHELQKISGSSEQGIEVLQVLTGTRQEVYNTEQWIHEELTDRGFYHQDSEWTVETFDQDCEELLYSLVEDSGLKVVSP